MYVVNPEKITNKVKCKKVVAQYFLDKDVPLLSRVGEYYYFAKSELFQSEYNKSPFWIKWAVNFD